MHRGSLWGDNISNVTPHTNMKPCAVTSWHHWQKIWSGPLWMWQTAGKSCHLSNFFFLTPLHKALIESKLCGSLFIQPRIMAKHIIHPLVQFESVFFLAGACGLHAYIKCGTRSRQQSYLYLFYYLSINIIYQCLIFFSSYQYILTSIGGKAKVINIKSNWSHYLIRMYLWVSFFGHFWTFIFRETNRWGKTGYLPV